MLNRLKGFICLNLFVVIAGAVGCQEPKYFPVDSKIVDESGQPIMELAGAAISFEATHAPVSAVGEVRGDASFTLTTETSGDGCLPGEHRVSIGRVFLAADAPQPLVIDPKYESYETSGLTVNVEKKRNQVELKVKRLE